MVVLWFVVEIPVDQPCLFVMFQQVVDTAQVGWGDTGKWGVSFNRTVAIQMPARFKYIYIFNIWGLKQNMVIDIVRPSTCDPQEYGNTWEYNNNCGATQ
jgi:hypothetical protein